MNLLSDEKLESLQAAFRKGFSARAAGRIAGVSKVTALRYRLWLRDKTPCKCGQAAGHRGWCHARYAASAARQQVFPKRMKKEYPTFYCEMLPVGLRLFLVSGDRSAKFHRLLADRLHCTVACICGGEIFAIRSAGDRSTYFRYYDPQTFPELRVIPNAVFRDGTEDLTTTAQSEPEPETEVEPNFKSAF